MDTKMVSLWKDESGSIISTELVLIGSLMSIGLISGLVQFRNALLGRLENVTQQIENLDQSYSIDTINVNIEKEDDAKNRPMEVWHYEEKK